jgi:tRNA-splicing ligase RtcB
MKNRSILDTNAVLKRAGYGGMQEFPKIAKYASTLRWDSEEVLLYEVKRIFGDPEGNQYDPHGKTAPVNMFLDIDIPVEHTALTQMYTALRLPVAVRGAVMPDVHPGYSLPIGGVVALQDAVAPAFVGFDIGCQMCMSVIPAPVDHGKFEKEKDRQDMLKIILKNTSFGLGADTGGKLDDPVMDNPLWDAIPFLKRNKELAKNQLGSSGGGNHFCSVGNLYDFGLSSWAILSHSGSRGIGKRAGEYYAALADKVTAKTWKGVPKGYGWLPMDSDEGKEYWAVMNLLIQYASACHELIHDRILRATRVTGDVAQISCVHNYASLQDGLIVHRKGAIDASKGKLGIIPGTCGTTSFVVEGLGNEDSLMSASHGAGRLFSSSEARRRYDKEKFLGYMERMGITHYGIAANETPDAYKDIFQVIQSERRLVTGRFIFRPKVVVMGGGKAVDDGD